MELLSQPMKKHQNAMKKTDGARPEDALKLAQNAAEKAVPVIQKHLVEAKKITASLKG